MAKKSNTGLYVGIAAVVVVIAIVVGVIIANNNKGGAGDNGGDAQTSSLTASDLAKIDEAIAYGEFDEMQALSKSIQNGEVIGKVVKVDGLVSHPGTTYSIVQASEDGTKKIGTKFVIEGMDEANYPKDGTRVIITGKIVEESPLVYIIKTVPEMVVTQ